MLARNTIHFVEFVAALFMCGAEELAIAASAIAVVTVTVIGPTAGTLQPMTVFPQSVEMIGSNGAELSIINHSDTWREVNIEIIPEGDKRNCRLHYSPKQSSIPPGGSQVVRLLAAADRAVLCQEDFSVRINAPHESGQRVYEIPVHTTPE